MFSVEAAAVAVVVEKRRKRRRNDNKKRIERKGEEGADGFGSVVERKGEEIRLLG